MINNTKEFFRLRSRLQNLTHRIKRGENVNMAYYNRLSKIAFKLAQKISGKANLRNAINNAKKISAATRIQKAFRQKIRTNKQFLDEYRKWKISLLNNENSEIVNNMNTSRLINYANKKYETSNLNMARNMIVNKMHGHAKKIQTAFRKSRLTNEKFIKLYHAKEYYANEPVKMNSVVIRTIGKKPNPNTITNYTNTLNVIRRKRNTNVKTLPAVKKIQSIFRGYKSRNISTRKQFLLSLSKDGRFDYYVEVLAKLEHLTDRTLQQIRESYNKNPLSEITGIIGVCHYKPRPHKVVQNVKNVRKSLPQLRKKTPREYLQSFRKQFAYVAKEYSKMDDKNKKEYRDRLHSELSGRPCLENLLDSLAKSLVKPEFIWVGKSKNFANNPLVKNNVRYLGFGPNLRGRKGLVNTAITTWAQSKNKPVNWNSKNLNTRKKMFWNMIKNLPVSMIHNGNVVNGTLSLHNINGKKFKSSALANTLNYI